MPQRIVIIQGHPDPAGGHYGHALAEAYAEAAREAGHETRMVTVAKLDFPLLRTEEYWKNAAPPPDIQQAQEAIRWANHIVLFYPLWLGTMPAVLKGFLEQVFRPSFISDDPDKPTSRLLKGRSARIVVTMGMPAALYRWYFRGHSVKSLTRNILKFVGIKPVKRSLIGLVASKNPAAHEKWLKKIRQLGRLAQ